MSDRTRRLLIAGTAVFVWWLATPDARQAVPADADPHVQRLVDSIAVSHLREMLTTLTSFETRNTLSNPNSTTPASPGSTRRPPAPRSRS